jgi:hypothetical protein
LFVPSTSWLQAAETRYVLIIKIEKKLRLIIILPSKNNMELAFGNISF